MKKITPQLCIQLATFTTLFAWGIIHIFWEGPYRALFWSEDYFSHIVEAIFQMQWQEYADSPTVNSNIALFSKVIGAFLVACSFLVFLSKDLFQRVGKALVLCSGILVAVFLIKTFEVGFRWGLFIEHGSQFLIPALTYFYLSGKVNNKNLLFYLKVAVCLTFFGHGLFAIGYYPVPGKFTDMVIEVLGTSESTAKHLLAFAGIVDFALCILIWIPDTSRFAAAYCVFWGFATALARPLSYASMDVISAESTMYWAMQFLYRGPHYLVPLAVLIMILNHRNR